MDDMREPGTGQDSGSIMIALVLIVMPLLVLVSSAITTMTTRNYGQIRSIHNEQAMLAVESGLDEALYISRTAGLVSGTNISRTVGPDFSFVVEPLLASTDGIDNDGDTDVDEADENVYELTITGTYGNVTRKVIAYLGSTPGAMNIEGAAMTHNPSTVIEFSDGVLLIAGADKNIDGSPGPEPDMWGAAAAPPGTAADLLSNFVGPSQGDVTGIGPNPSFGEASAPIDLPTLEAEIIASATVVLTSASYSNQTWGDASIGDWEIVYRNGNVAFNGSNTGAGLLFVKGQFHAGESFRWDGIVIIDTHSGSDKDISLEDDAHINGALILGPTVRQLFMEDDPVVEYSSEAVAGASSVATGTGQILLSGWQEIPIN